MEHTYAWLDRPEVLAALFHPRPEPPGQPAPSAAQDLRIPVAPGVALGARFHNAGPAAPTIIFFHGNGEIVADYDEMGPIYQQLGLSFLPVDYRGYGRSGGQPGAATLIQDSHVVLDFIVRRRQLQGQTGPLVVMGRSMGSAPALELAATHPRQVAGLILESAFAYTGPLLKILGLDLPAFQEADGFGNLDKMAQVQQPCLIIHADADHLIPFSDAQALYTACPVAAKMFLTIPGANHNNLLLVGFNQYMATVQQFCQGLTLSGG